jgi:hypothetical protein
MAPESNSSGAVLFRVGRHLHFLPATVAVRIVPVPPLGRVPGAPNELAGLALVDGEVVPVMSVGGSRSAMIVVAYLGERVGIVGVDLVATGRFDAVSDQLVYAGEHARLFDMSALIARVRDTRWAV